MKLFWLLVLASCAMPQTADFRAVRQCAQCHAAQAKPQPATSMAHAMELPSECTILSSHPVLTFKDGNYSYRIERKGASSWYTVSDGKDTLSAEIGWAFGMGSAGQTYVYEKDGKMYESRVSYYSAVGGLDFTIGATNTKPADLLQAAGRQMVAPEQRACFGCHSTNTVENREMHLDRLIPGVQCEHCHGSTENHLTGLKKGDAALAQMKSLQHMSAEDTANFCGQCHRTWDDIASSGVKGIINVRFQPYRLTNSKCYDADDARIACTACHDPHREVDSKLSDYDSECQACHAGGKPAAKTCKVASTNCASCHMPKVEIPHSHKLFADHEIRIVRPDAPYPN